ncbi:MAG TPA: hypothetical protein VJ953_20600 [Saprospiraceae bacterium]|nr:hypothetical protein [Saprospiraceae bacterium]
MQQSFKRAAEAYKSLQLAQKQLEHTRERIQAARKELQVLDKKVDREYREYQDLENASMRKLFNKILGKGEDQLEKEKQDYLEAVLRFNQKRKELELIEFEEKVLRDKLTNADQIKVQFDQELQKYSHYLVEQNTKTGQYLLQTEKTIQSKLGDLKEINEAINSGQAVEEQLDQILKLLDRAGWWGAPEWRKDNPLKVAANKIESIDTAVKLIPIANHKLQKFILELKDIYLDDEAKLDYNQTAFSRFSEGFYDSMIIDWVLKGKAKNATNVVSSTRDKLIVTLRSLKMRKKNLQAAISLLQKRKRDTILKELSN